MSDPRIRLFEPVAAQDRDSQTCIGRLLLESGIITSWQLLFAMQREKHWNATVTDILLSRGWISDAQALAARAWYFGAQQVDLVSAPPDRRLQGLLSPEFCLKHAVVPWISMNGLLIFATSRPEDFEKLRPELPSGPSGIMMAITSEAQIQTYVSQIHRRVLTDRTETRVPLSQSCRGWGQSPALRYGFCAAICLMILTLMVLDLRIAFLTAIGIAVITQLSASLMKFSALLASQKFQHHTPRPEVPPLSRLPRISVLVPLFHERDIAQALVRRLSLLTYPKALLDVILVLEQKDTLTKTTLSVTKLPRWMRVIEVPEGSGLTTKPRALNFALDYCRGDIIGIWDAEDAPAPDQLQTIAAHFAQADPDVACLQGVLDYYNPYTNWMSRCFTLEYSMWFRVVLRGMSQLGSAIPLGGTTLFLRRDVIEEVGRWDAHNVTEDADLGIRLNRYGYRTELAFTVTQEEANCHLGPWIKQRSRWLKGYMVTYLVHMRRPLLLWRELGARKFIGFNLIFATTLSHFMLAPIIWSFWLLMYGVSVPWLDAMPFAARTGTAALFIAVAILDIALAVISMRGQNRRGLMAWAITLPVYFPLATFGLYKGLYELVVKPFYWDKTAHGKTPEGQSAQFSAVSA
ncbi:glycosyltransferase [Cognatishimia sp. WU-CL00825]|uniref:glycosyltransferase family 2 protein n=1 Tax=Cognatishimia sp. WU-CL00825 TaxID=3127658 RepID=UPI0031081F4D